MVCFYFLLFIINNLSHCVFVLLLCSVITPPPTDAHTSSCRMALTTTVRPIPLPTCIAAGGVWAQGPALPSPSPFLPPHPPPPPPAPLVHGHVPPQPWCQTTLITARWVPWCLHHESPAGRFVHHLGLGDQLLPILLVNMQAMFTVLLTEQIHF